MPSETLSGKGPWTFETETDLAPGESWILDFRNMTHNGRRRWFKPYLPLDDLQVTNADTGNSVEININDAYQSRVLANSVETFPDEGITNLRLINRGSSTIAAGDLVVEVAKSAYDADDRAREQATRSFSEQALRDLVPGL